MLANCCLLGYGYCLCMCSYINTLLLSRMLTWQGCLLKTGRRMLLALRETVATLTPPLWCQAVPAWRQTPLLTDAPAKSSLLKSHILNKPSSPAAYTQYLRKQSRWK